MPPRWHVAALNTCAVLTLSLPGVPRCHIEIGSPTPLTLSLLCYSVVLSLRELTLFYADRVRLSLNLPLLEPPKND